MTLVFPKEIINDYKFNKKEIIADIKNNIFSPWDWYNIEKFSKENDKPEPEYDLIIIRNKLVTEDTSIQRQFSTINNFKKSLYSIVIGIYVVENLTWNNVCKSPSDFVTGAIQINSAAALLNFIEDIDNNKGGIQSC